MMIQKLATRNLPPDIIDKIQVFDDLSDQSKFTGIDDGNRVKTINIITKKNAQHGYFGKVVAAGGTDETYDESINFHRFDGNQQISLLGQANDINKQNFDGMYWEILVEDVAAAVVMPQPNPI